MQNAALKLMLIHAVIMQFLQELVSDSWLCSELRLMRCTWDQVKKMT